MKKGFCMKLVLQRVLSASVSVDGSCVSKIGQGLLVLVGLAAEDTQENFDHVIKKMCNLRIFADENQKMNKSIQDIAGEILLVSQFTLYADCKKGNRPSFIKAMPPEQARLLYARFVERTKELYSSEKVKDGIFGADMSVQLTNDGPVTIIL